MTLIAVVVATVEAVGHVSQKRQAGHVVRPPSGKTARTLKGRKLVSVHKVLKQHRLVRADGLVTQGTVPLVVTVVTLAHFAAANMVVEHWDRLECGGTHAALGKGVALHSMTPLIFLFDHDVVGTTRTRCFDFMRKQMRHEITMVGSGNFFTHRARRIPVYRRCMATSHPRRNRRITAETVLCRLGLVSVQVAKKVRP